MHAVPADRGPVPLAMECDVLKRGLAPLGEGRDETVAAAALIAAQREDHRVPAR
jgi:hypothetical protein